MGETTRQLYPVEQQPSHGFEFAAAPAHLSAPAMARRTSLRLPGSVQGGRCAEPDPAKRNPAPLSACGSVGMTPAVYVIPPRTGRPYQPGRLRPSGDGPRRQPSAGKTRVTALAVAGPGPARTRVTSSASGRSGYVPAMGARSWAAVTAVSAKVADRRGSRRAWRARPDRRSQVRVLLRFRLPLDGGKHGKSLVGPSCGRFPLRDLDRNRRRGRRHAATEAFPFAFRRHRVTSPSRQCSIPGGRVRAVCEYIGQTLSGKAAAWRLRSVTPLTRTDRPGR
jgi:hypothetical protein